MNKDNQEIEKNYVFRVDIRMRYMYKIDAKNLLEAEEKMGQLTEEEILRSGFERDAPETDFGFFEVY